MSAKILDGRIVAAKIKEDLKKDIQHIKAKYGKVPALAVVQVGENHAADVFIKSQTKISAELGIEYNLNRLSEKITQKELNDCINRLNNDKNINGIFLQLPLPKGLDVKEAQTMLSPKKDVEAVHPENLGRVIFGRPVIYPCTALAVMELVNSTGISLKGKNAVIIGYSDIVGKPVALIFLEKFATITVCHRGTSERGMLADYVRLAEILVVAVGKPGLVKGEWIRPGSIVIDVGINKVNDKIVGDVEFEEAKKKAAYITPVPGGIGPLTVTILMRNTVEAFKRQTASEGRS